MPQSLAKLIKTKYPGQYDDMDDKELEAKVRSKYPGIYDDIPDSEPVKPGFLSRAKDSLYNATIGGVKSLTVDLPETLGTAAGRFKELGSDVLHGKFGEAFNKAKEFNAEPDVDYIDRPLQFLGADIPTIKADARAGNTGAALGGLAAPTLFGGMAALGMKGIKGKSLPKEIPIELPVETPKPGVRALLPEKAGVDFNVNPDGIAGRPIDFRDSGLADFRDTIPPSKPGTSLSPFDQVGRSDVAELPVKLDEPIAPESSRFNADRYKTKAIGTNTRVPGSIFDTVPDRLRVGEGPFDPNPMNLAPDTAIMPRDIPVELPGTEVRLDTKAIPDAKPIKAKEFPRDKSGSKVGLSDRAKAERAAVVKETVAEKIDANPTAVTPEQIKSVVSSTTKKKSPWKSLYDSVGKSVSSQLKDYGEKGIELSKLLEDTETEAGAYSGRMATEVRKIDRILSEPEKVELIKVLDGQIPYSEVTNPKVASAYGTLRTVLNTLGKDAESSGLHLRSRGESLPFKMMEGEYYPHQYPKGFWADKEGLIAKLVSKGKSYDQAKTIVDNAHTFGEKFLAPQHARELNLPGYIEDTAVIERYIHDMGRKITIAKKLGAKDIADIDSPISKIMAETTNPTEVGKLLENYFNRGPIPEGWKTNVAQVATKAEVAAHLSLFAIQNLGDLASIPIRAGVKNFVKAAADTLRDPHISADKASDSGAYAILRKEALKDIDSGDFLSRAYGIAPVEKTIRTIGALAGRASVQDLFVKAKKGNKTALARLQDLTKEDVKSVIKQDSLTPEQIDFAGGRAVELTSGVPNKLSLPPAFTEGNPILRLPLLFKRFAFINTKNLTNLVKNEPTVAGKVAKLTAALTAYQIAGEVTGDLKAGIKSLITQENELAKRNELSPVDTGNEVVDRIIANFMQSFFFGLIGDVSENLAHGKSGLLSIVGGPVASDAGNLTEAGIQAFKGHKGTEKTGIAGNKYRAPYDGDRYLGLKKFAARQVPFIGAGLAARLDKKNEKRVPKFR